MAFTNRVVIILCVIAAVSCDLQRTTEEEKATLANYIANQKSSLNYRFRLRYHVAPPVGWMNDPNGFTYYKGEYHLFYQFYPYNSSWGPMHWGHSTSTNLVVWKELSTALIPEKEQCFSGSGIVVGDSLMLMYTGHEITTTDPFYNETQYLANSTDGVNFVKYEGNPILSYRPDDSPDFRDPKVWKHGDEYYVVIGSKSADQTRGRVLLYKSQDLKEWEYLSIIGESDGTMGYMWECPDFFELNGTYVLLMSPQGMTAQGDRYKNLYQTGYILGSFNYTTNTFTPEVAFQEIDFGHDFYATQTTLNNNKRIMMAWFGMWETSFPEKVDGWCGAMTIARELTLRGNRILQNPVAEMTTLREATLAAQSLTTNQVIEFGKTGELILHPNLTQSVELLLEGTNGGGQAWLRWNPSVGKVVVDRGSNDIRQVEWVPIGSHSWRLFLDASSLELFCGEGEVVFSSRVYPEGNWKVTNLSPQTFNIEAYTLKTSVPFPSSSSSLNPLIGIIFLTLIPLLQYNYS